MNSEKEFSAEEQKIIYFNKKAYENGELMYCKNMYDIADQLQNDETVFSYGGEEYVVKVEGDKIIITACIIDSMAYASDRHWDEYVIDFSDCKMDAFGSVYIDSTAFIEKMTEFSAYRYENGWISAETIGCWEEKVDAIIEQQAEVMGIDYNSLDDATKEELREQSIICADLEDKLINVYLSNRKTASDEFNEFWDEMMLGAGVACALMFLVTPAGVAELATFTIGIADGTKKIWQGDTAEGVTEIGISVIGEIAYVAKEVSEGRKVAKLMDGATGAVDDLDFAIDASKFDDLEYIKANPLSENYYLSDEEIRYRQFWRRVEEGRNVMPEDEYAKWMYSDSKVVDYLTIEEVDYDDILSLRKSEQMSQTIDDAASVQKIIASEGGINTNYEAHNVVNYVKYKEVLKTTEMANPLVESLRTTGNLPPEYITKADAALQGWRPGRALGNSVPGGQIGGDEFLNSTGILPSSNGRVWYEADVGINNAMSRAKQPGTRLVYSNDGLMYITYDHYETVYYIGKWKN